MSIKSKFKFFKSLKSLIQNIYPVLGFEYRDASFYSTLINLPKNRHSKKKSTCLKWRYRLFGQNYRDATLSTIHVTVSGITILCLKSREKKFNMHKIMNQKSPNCYV